MNHAPDETAQFQLFVFQSHRKTHAGLVQEDYDYLFLGQRGPLAEWRIRAIVEKYAYQARLEDVTAHTLRHSFTKNLVDAVTPLDQVATLLRH